MTTNFLDTQNISSTESNRNSYQNAEQFNQLNASIDENFSSTHVRIVIQIPQMKTSLNWCQCTRQPKNGFVVRATYHGTRVHFQFVLHDKTEKETKYEFLTREPLHGPIEYRNSYLKFKDKNIVWFVHKSRPW